MPRPKPKRASPNFTVRPHSLIDAQQEELLRLLGYDVASLEAAQCPGYRVVKREPGAPLRLAKISEPEAQAKDPYEAIRGIEMALGLYIDGEEHLDHAPRPADYRKEFRQTQRDAGKLLNKVANWSEYYRDQFTLQGKDIHEVERALAILHDVSSSVVRDMAGKSSMGARKQTALTHTVRSLRKIFRDYRQGKETRGQERTFLEAALLAGRIIRTDYDLPRLLRDPRCALSEHRAKTPKSLPRKAQKRYMG